MWKKTINRSWTRRMHAECKKYFDHCSAISGWHFHAKPECTSQFLVKSQPGNILFMCVVLACDRSSKETGCSAEKETSGKILWRSSRGWISGALNVTFNTILFSLKLQRGCVQSETFVLCWAWQFFWWFYNYGWLFRRGMFMFSLDVLFS